jgi:hypothetical protein
MTGLNPQGGRFVHTFSKVCTRLQVSSWQSNAHFVLMNGRLFADHFLRFARLI